MGEIRDYKLNNETRLLELAKYLKDSGFQASHLGEAVEIIKEMRKNNSKIYLSFTSNIAASGLRGVIAQLLSMKLVDVIITSSGTVDEDFIKSNKPYLKGSFDADDGDLGKNGINRMGNINVPNDRYMFMEDEMPKILKKAYEQKKTWTPSEIIHFVGQNMNDENSILFQAAKNNIPIFCPGVTDGAFGLQLCFFQQNHPDFQIEVAKDMKAVIDTCLEAEKTGGIILGGGIAKHHAIIANLMRDGFDYCVYVSMSSPFTGSLSGATTSEAKSWGKIRPGAKSITVHSDVTIVFPFLAAALLE
ncbi:deoxyhypusine synthase [Candidatus Woesearchaeota archaeon]|nr:deoxyhypusine synthase [Candidatus Woesearchaeota archaeon]